MIMTGDLRHYQRPLRSRAIIIVSEIYRGEFADRDEDIEEGTILDEEASYGPE